MVIVNYMEKDAEVRRIGRPLPAAEWKVFSPEDGSFAAQMPHPVKLDTPSKVEHGIPLAIRLYSGSDRTNCFSAGYYDRSYDPRVVWTPQSLLGGIREKVRSQHPRADIKEDSVEAQGWKALKISVPEQSDHGAFRYLIVPTETRCYILLANGRHPYWDERLVDRFFDSFRLNSPGGGS